MLNYIIRRIALRRADPDRRQPRHLLPVLHRQHARRHGAPEHRRQARDAGADREVEGRARLRQAAVLERRASRAARSSPTPSSGSARCRCSRSTSAAPTAKAPATSATRWPRRMWVSIQLALPIFMLQVIASTAFALLLVMFRHTRLDLWGVVLCVLMLSISSLFYIIVGQYLFSRVLKLVPISGYAGGLDVLRFLVLPIAAVAARAPGRRGAPVPRDVPRGDRQGLRAHRARQGPVGDGRAVPPRAAQRADPDHHQRRQLPAVRVPRQPGVRELLRHSRASAPT